MYATKPVGEGTIDENALRAALTVRSRRRVSSDNVLSVEGIAWELDQGYLARQVVTVVQCFAAPDESPYVEHEGKRLVLRSVDPVANARRKRPPRGGPLATKPKRPVDFDPARALRPCDDAEDSTPKGGLQ